MSFTLLDWVVLAVVLAICFFPSFWFARRSSRGLEEFFSSGRSVPWWLAGVSMVATTFSTDTPNLVTDIVRRQGVAGNWQWWAFAVTGMTTVFLYARLWRRSGVLTDLEFYELRYSGRAAAFLRGFRAVYLGLLFNCLIIAAVNLAACKIAGVLFGLPMWQTLLFVGILNVVFASHAGLWGVLVIDLVQFGIMMASAVLAAVYAVNAPEVGGLSALMAKVGAMSGPGGLNYLDLVPDFSSHWDLAVAVFLMPLAVQWWAVWYPGAEPGGGSYVAQRMLACRTEKDALSAVLFFNFAHYVLRPWPWILVALASLVVFPDLAAIRAAFPGLDPALLGHDAAYPAMLRYLPAGLVGLMIGGLIAANSSTVLTQLNWGASYLVHDLYRRFLRPGESERHYVSAARWATILLFLASSGLTLVLESAKSVFDLILQIGAGTGLLYLVRWFWWQVNAWCEIVAMVASFLVSVAVLVLKQSGVVDLSSSAALLLTVGITTPCWVAAAYLAPGTALETLQTFYQKVKPSGLGWRRIAAEMPPVQRESAREDSLPLALLRMSLGLVIIYSALFGTGRWLMHGPAQAAWLLAVAVVAAVVLIRLRRSPV